MKTKYKRAIHALIVVAIAFFSILASLILAAPQGAIAQRINCSKATSTVELKYCSQQSYQAADKKLNQVYQQVSSRLNREPKQLLTTAEQAWIKFRDNNCNFETYANRGGTGYEIFRNGCLERLTKQRTQDLQNYLSSR